MNKKFFNNKWNILLILLLLFALGSRIWIFELTKDQPEWWDAADYLTGAKVIGKDIDTNYEFNFRRPFLLALFWGGIYYFSGDEIALRITMILFSLACIWLTYLLGKNIYSKRVGLIAGGGMSVFWLFSFFSGRLMTEVPSVTLLTAGMYFFYRGYIKKESKKYVYLAGLFFGLMIFTRAAAVIGLFGVFFYLLITEKLNFLKKKDLWVMFVIILLVLSPFIIYVQLKTGNAFGKITGIGEGRFTHAEGDRMWGSNFLDYTKYFPNFLYWPFLILFLIGCYSFIEMVLGFDLILKNESKKLKKSLFLFLWIASFYVAFGFIGDPSAIEPRYLMAIFPAVFIVMGKGSIKLFSIIKKYNKEVAAIVVILLLAYGGYLQFKAGDEMIKGKATSYQQVKEAGLWMKANSVAGDTIVSASLPQIWYYSERKVIPFYLNTPLANATEEMFEANLSYWKPRYIMISAFEPLQPGWSFEYVNKHSDEWGVVNGWFSDAEKTKPIVLIYEHKGEY